MKKLIAVVLFAMATSVSAEPSQQVISLDQAIQLALQHQPTLRQARASIEAAAGRVDSAYVAKKPTLSLGASVNYSNTFYSVTNTVMGTSVTSGGFTDPSISANFGANAAWRLYDFGQTAASIAAAEANLAAAQATAGSTTLDARRNVEAAYLEAVARSKLIGVAETTVKSEETHLDQAKKFVAAQAKDPIEVAQAQARAANAKSALAQAQSNHAIAIANLRAAMGYVDGNNTIAIDPSWPQPPNDEPMELQKLVDVARQHRPEIVAFDKQIVAANAQLDASYAERRPVLSANAAVAYGPHTDDWNPPPTFAVGLNLTWQLYDGGRAHADQRIARAGIESAEASRDALLVDLTSQIESARSQIVANKANVSASTEAVSAAQTQLHLADARYSQGLGSQIELADAQTAVTTAEGNLILAQFQLADAWLQLRRQLGES